MREDALLALVERPVRELVSAALDRGIRARCDRQAEIALQRRDGRASAAPGIGAGRKRGAACSPRIGAGRKRRATSRPGIGTGRECRATWALESALAESAGRSARLELDAAAADELLDDAAAQITWLRESNLLEQAIADELHARDTAAALETQVEYERVSAELAVARSAAESASTRLDALEKDYHELLADFERYTAKELEETRREALAVNQLTKAIQRSPFWSLRTAARKLYRFGRE